MNATSTHYAILGLLAFEPMSGYDIRRASTDALSHFWHESYGQIYPALAALERARLIRRQPSKQDARAKKVYELTAAGRKALVAWRKRAPQEKPFRNELLLKLFTGVPREARVHVARVRAEETARLEEYARLERRLDVEAKDQRLWRATLRYGVHRSRAILAWCDETLKELA